MLKMADKRCSVYDTFPLSLQVQGSVLDTNASPLAQD